MRRRNFLALAGSGVVVAPFIMTRRSALWAAGNTHQIVIVNNSVASKLTGGGADGATIGTYTVSQVEINRMVDAAIIRLTGAADVGLAWEQVIKAAYPSLTATTEIGIKINTAIGHPPTFAEGYPANKRCPYAPRGEVVNAMISGLAKMLGGTYKVEKLTVFDCLPSYGSLSTMMVTNGFPAGGTDDAYDIPASTGKPRYVLRPRTYLDATGFTIPATGPFGTTFSQKYLDVVTLQKVWLNLSVPKVNIGAGVTASMKNTYGMTNSCGQSHPEPFEEAIIHDCVPLFYKNITSKVPCALNILDALGGNYAKEAYYGPSFVANSLAMSTDPVSIDYYAAELVNNARGANGWGIIKTPVFDTTANTSARYLNPSGTGAVFPGSVNTSAGKPARFAKYVDCLSLGVAEQIGLGYMNAGERLVINQTPIHTLDSMHSGDVPAGRPLQVTRNRAFWRIGIQFDNSGREHNVSIRILDIRGREIRSLPTRRTRQSYMGIDWNGQASNGSTIAHGVYCCESRIDGITYSSPLHY